MNNTITLKQKDIIKIKSILRTLPDTQWCECLQRLCNRYKLCQASRKILNDILEEMRRD